MKALTIQQPYASAIMQGSKIYETRTWHPGRVEQFALHAGKTMHRAAQVTLHREIADWPQTLPLGAVLGIVKIVDVTDAEELLDEIDDLEDALGLWGPDHLAWELEVIEVFPNPIPARGQLGFWDWQPRGNGDKHDTGTI